MIYYIQYITGKTLLHAEAGPDHVFADVAKHLIQDPASAYDLLLCPKHVNSETSIEILRRPRPARGRPAFFISTFGHSCILGVGLSHIISVFWPKHLD